MSDLEPTAGKGESAASGARLNHHPRIARLRDEVAALPIGQDYRCRLFCSIGRHADQIAARPECAPGDGRADLDVLQALAQVYLNERNLMAWIESCRRAALEER